MVLTFALTKNIFETILSRLKNKKPGYVCVVDVNVVAIANKEQSYLKIINDSLINTCDGSSIAFLATIIKNKKHESYNGPSLFEYFIENNNYTHTIVGGEKNDYEKVLRKLNTKHKDASMIKYIELPFESVENFDYAQIAKKLNKNNSDFIWICLGAPKQEIFMSKIIGLLENGVMFGIGAAVKFYHGELNLPNYNFFGLKFIWIMRIVQEPRKIIKRHLSYLMMLPKLIINEILK